MESKRQLQVASTIQRSISTVFQKEGTYMYGDALVTVTGVKLTPDLGIARIYLSIYNTPAKDMVLEVVRHHKQKLRQSLAARIRKRVRRIPVLEFYVDETLDEMYRLNELFDQIETTEDHSEEE